MRGTGEGKERIGAETNGYREGEEQERSVEVCLNGFIEFMQSRRYDSRGNSTF